MLQAPSRASTSSSSSFQPVTRQNTMSSHDGARSMRQSKRYSVTALYLSMSAKEKDLEIEDDLARGIIQIRYRLVSERSPANVLCSPKNPTRTQGQNLFPIKEEFRARKGCQIPRLTNCIIDPESHGFRRGSLIYPFQSSDLPHLRYA
jgi:hypothetical protein